MSKGPSKVATGVRKGLYMVVVTIMALGGLGLAAGGGYLLLADGAIDLPSSMRQVLAEEVTSTSSPLHTVAATDGAPALTIVTPTGATGGVSAQDADPTPTPTYVVEVRLVSTSTPMPTPSPTATRVVRATGVPTQTPTPLAGGPSDSDGSEELPDTGFGEFVQPLAGLGLASFAIVTHAIRRRR